jgi:hypothetical protein
MICSPNPRTVKHSTLKCSSYCPIDFTSECPKVFHAKLKKCLSFLSVLKPTYRCKMTNEIFQADRESKMSIRKMYPIFWPTLFHGSSFHNRQQIMYWGLFISSCIDRFIHIAFPARQIFFSTVFIDTFISSCFNRFLHDSARSVSVWDFSDTVRVWTCRSGQQWKQTYSTNEFSVVFIHIQMHFHYGQWKIYWISMGVFNFVRFTDKRYSDAQNKDTAWREIVQKLHTSGK